MKLRNILILLAVLAVLVLAFLRFRPTEQVPLSNVQGFIWMINMDSINRVEIDLPRQNAGQKFVKIVQGDKFPWFFDDARHSPVDDVRWSGGIPLLLSGPQADRKVIDNASEEDLATFGLSQPSMKIELGLDMQSDLEITLGNKTPDGKRVYVRAPNTRIVATVDGSWFDIMQGLVTNPPYLAAK